jgi:predicted amino acid-binding ACT domain protein
MLELATERKAVIDTLHINQHWPRFIENEPADKTGRFKEYMDSLIHTSDALLMIYALTTGQPEDTYAGKTPIEYELDEYLALCEMNSARPRVRVLKKDMSYLGAHAKGGGKPAPGSAEDMLCEVQKKSFGSIERILTQHSLVIDETVQTYTNQASLRELVEKFCRDESRGLSERGRRGAGGRKKWLIALTFPDRIGQLASVCQALAALGLNVDFINHVVLSDVGNFMVLASEPRLPRGYDESRRRKEIAQVIGTQVQEDAAELHDPIAPNEVKAEAEPYKGNPHKVIIAIEMRLMDVPGQLYSVTDALASAGYNIINTQQSVCDPEFPNQFATQIYVTHDGLKTNAELKIARKVAGLEADLARLVGVKGLNVKVIWRDARLSAHR